MKRPAPVYAKRFEINELSALTLDDHVSVPVSSLDDSLSVTDRESSQNLILGDIESLLDFI